MEAIPMIVILNLGGTSGDGVRMDEPATHQQTDIMIRVSWGGLLQQGAEEPELPDDVIDDAEAPGQ